MSDPKLRRSFKNRFAQKLDKPAPQPGLLGDGATNVIAGDNLVYVRVNGLKTTAVCNSVQPVDDLPVWLGYDIYDPKTYRVLGERIITGGGGGTSVIGAHAPTHAYGGRDPVKVDSRQIMQLRMYVIASGLYTIGVVPGTIYIDNMPKLIGTDNLDGTYTHATIDLITHMVTTADKAKYVMITIDNTGALVATAGSEVDLTALDYETDMPAPPANWRYILGAVRMFAGQMEIVEHAENNDYLDFRWPIPHTHDGTELGLDVDDIADVTITDPATGEVFVFDGTDWINQTLAEADIASAEALATDIQNLADHEADLDNPHQVTAAQILTRWEVLTNGNPSTPELMFDENGDVLYVEVS